MDQICQRNLILKVVSAATNFRDNRRQIVGMNLEECHFLEIHGVTMYFFVCR